MAIFAFEVAGDEVEVGSFVLALRREIVLPVQDTARSTWEVLGIDYQADWPGLETAGVNWMSASGGGNSIELYAGLFMADQGTAFDSDDQARDINFGLSNPTLIDAWTPTAVYAASAKKTQT